MANRFFSHIEPEKWNDWRWQMRNRLTGASSIEKILHPPEDVLESVRKAARYFRMAITPYYADLIDFENIHCPIRAQAVPSEEETQFDDVDLDDPLHEEVDSPVPGLTHRYPDRVLLVVTHICAMYCRHCTRRRMVGQNDLDNTEENLDAAVEYIARTKEVKDVVISGGDPLTLSTEKLERILKKVRAVPHVKIIRIGTRTPVVLPMRITERLVSMLRAYHPIFINVHFNHSKEMTREAARACGRLADAGFPLGNQSVLLRGVNDCPEVMKELNYALLSARVRPYYMYQCDLSRGIGHFRTSLGKGIEIVESLRGHMSGLGVPVFVVDLPGGGGKVPVVPNYLISMSDNKAVLRNFEGKISVYESPQRWDSACDHDPACQREDLRAQKGPAMLLRKRHRILEPRRKDISES